MRALGWQRWASALLIASNACRKPAAHEDAAASASSLARPTPTPTPTPEAPGLTVTSQVEAAGLHVTSGTLRALGPTSAVWGFSDIALDASRTRLKIVRAEHGAPLGSLLPTAGLAVVNGGYFEADFRPSTWLIDDGVELAPKLATSKGGVLAVGPGGVYLGPLAQLGFVPALALQSFPLIVEPGGKAGIHSDDGRRAARTVACLVAGSLHFIVIAAPRGEGPTLFESADLMRAAPPGGFGCQVALNLDGGPSTGVWFAPQIAAKQRPPFAPVGYALAILPR